MNQENLIVYTLNRQDVITNLNGAWTAFALANDAPDLLPEKVIGRLIWDFITDETTRVLYREMFQQVRSGKVTRFHFRCDSPEFRRFMEMTITGQAGGGVKFESKILQQEERSRQELLDRHATRSEEWLRICGWCKRVAVNDAGWEAVEQAVHSLHLFGQRNLPNLTHGMCEACFQAMNETVAELRAYA